MSSLYKSCLHKKKFITLEHVKKVAKAKSEQYGVNFNYYLCPYCACYHLTRKETNEKHIEDIKADDKAV